MSEEKATPAFDETQDVFIPSSIPTSSNDLKTKLHSISESNRSFTRLQKQDHVTDPWPVDSLETETQHTSEDSSPYADLTKIQTSDYMSLIQQNFDQKEDQEQDGLAAMSVQDVCRLLREEIIVSDDIIDKFHDRNVDGVVLNRVDAKILQEEFNMPGYHCRKLLRYIQEKRK
ncbi:uncharacterized protein LOC144442978 [Glandiceps talaboti]